MAMLNNQMAGQSTMADVFNSYVWKIARGYVRKVLKKHHFFV